LEGRANGREYDLDHRFLLLGAGESEGATAGSTLEVGRRVVSDKRAGWEVRFLALPADADSSLLKALEEVDLHLPDVVLSLATVAPAEEVSVPTGAANLDDSSLRLRGADRSADRSKEPLDPSGPPTLGCTVPAERIVGAIRGGGIGAVPSDRAALPACNRLVYALLRYVSLRGGETWFQRRPPSGLISRIGAILTPEPATHPESGRAQHSLNVDTSVRAVSLALEGLSRWLEEEGAGHTGGGASDG
jgi:pyrrolidone-carboxylate peptidase